MYVLKDFGEAKRKRARLFPRFFRLMLREAASYGDPYASLFEPALVTLYTLCLTYEKGPDDNLL